MKTSSVISILLNGAIAFDWISTTEKISALALFNRANTIGQMTAAKKTTETKRFHREKGRVI